MTPLYFSVLSSSPHSPHFPLFLLPLTVYTAPNVLPSCSLSLFTQPPGSSFLAPTHCSRSLLCPAPAYCSHNPRHPLLLLVAHTAPGILSSCFHSLITQPSVFSPPVPASCLHSPPMSSLFAPAHYLYSPPVHSLCPLTVHQPPVSSMHLPTVHTVPVVLTFCSHSLMSQPLVSFLPVPTLAFQLFQTKHLPVLTMPQDQQSPQHTQCQPNDPSPHSSDPQTTSVSLPPLCFKAPRLSQLGSSTHTTATLLGGQFLSSSQ